MGGWTIQGYDLKGTVVTINTSGKDVRFWVSGSGYSKDRVYNFLREASSHLEYSDGRFSISSRQYYADTLGDIYVSYPPGFHIKSFAESFATFLMYAGATVISPELNLNLSLTGDKETHSGLFEDLDEIPEQKGYKFAVAVLISIGLLIGVVSHNVGYHRGLNDIPPETEVR